jgi:excisionase family DNA binding protein
MDEQVRSTYDVPEAARILGIGRSAAYEAVRRGEIPSIRLGKRLVVPRAALERMLLEGRLAVSDA